MRAGWLALTLGLITFSAAAGQQWAVDMFDHTSHDFGTVARGALVEHRFPFENIYVEDVHVVRVNSSCRCFQPSFEPSLLKTYQKGEIRVKLDTEKFTGRHDGTLTVVLDKPFPAEVQLNVYSYIRSDVVLDPGSARFGTVHRGTAVEKKLTVSYAGRSDWKIVEVEAPQPYLAANARELSRSLGEVTYELTVQLKGNAPVGYIKDHLIMVTNDRNPSARRVPVPVEAVVASEISVRPSPLPLGILRTGQKVTRNLVLQAKSPFRIVKIVVPDQRFQATASDVARPLHLVPVAFTAGDTPGKVTGTIRIETDLEGNKTVEVKVDGHVLAASPGSSAPAESAPGSSDPAAAGWQPR